MRYGTIQRCVTYYELIVEERKKISDVDADADADAGADAHVNPGVRLPQGKLRWQGERNAEQSKAK